MSEASNHDSICLDCFPHFLRLPPCSNRLFHRSEGVGHMLETQDEPYPRLYSCSLLGMV